MAGMELWSLWWVWLCGGLVLIILEVFAPGFILLGFGLAAMVVAGVVALFPGLGPAPLLLIFAVLSVLTWLGFRRGFRAPNDQTRVIHKDIND